MQPNPTLNRAARANQATQDEQLLASPLPSQVPFTHTDPWRVLRITGEFVEGFDTLANLGQAVTIFGSARTKPGDPMYEAAVETARLLAERGLRSVQLWVTDTSTPEFQIEAHRQALAVTASLGRNVGDDRG